MNHPYDDEYPSSEPVRVPTIVRQAHNDEFLSSDPLSENVPNQAAEPHLPQQEAAELRVEQREAGGAQPFLTEHFIPFAERHGPDTEQNRYSTDRPVSEFHIGKVVQKASKEFNADLMRAVEFTAEEAALYHRSTSAGGVVIRKQKCRKIIDIWLSRGGTRKILFDLKLLLTKAGEPNNKYEALIRDIVRTRGA